MVVCAMFGAVLMFGASAQAQTPATDQYLNATSDTTTTTPSSGVAGATDSGTSTSTGAGSSGAGTSGSAGAGTGTGGGAGGPAVPTVTFSLTFGASVPKDLKAAIDAALAQAGLGSGPAGVIPAKAVTDFLGTDLAKAIAGGGDAEAVGKAVAGLLLHPSAQSSAVLAALLIDPAILTAPPTQMVFTRTAAATGDFAKFQKGIVEGLSSIPSVYVELSGAATSFVKAFDKLAVPTVDNLDTAAGKAAFKAILVDGAVGNFGSKSTADSKLTPLGVRPISAEIPAPDNATLSGAMPYLLLLVVVFGALMWAVPALRRGPFRQREH
jgi:hypothetical protein